MNDPYAQLGAIPDTDPYGALGAVPDNVTPQSNPSGFQSLMATLSGTPEYPAMHELMHVARAIPVGLTHLGGNIIGDVGTGISQLGYNNAGNFLQNLGQQGANVTQAQMGINHPDLASTLTSGITQASPYMMALPERLGLMGLSKLAPSVGTALQSGLYGATQSSPGNAVSGAVKGAVGGALLSKAPALMSGAGSIGGKIYNTLTNSGVKNGIRDLYDSISNKLSPRDLNNVNVSNILNNYKDQLGSAKKLYDNVLNGAQEAGYGTTKAITPSQDTQGLLGDLQSKVHSKNISSDLKQSILNYQGLHSYENAHALQSTLGSEAADINSSLNSTLNERNTADALYNTRQSLLKDIPANFINNGDNDLANEYMHARDNWRQNIIPYQNVPQVWRAIRGKSFPTNIANTLSNTDSKGALETIRSHISASPQQSDSLLAQLLKTGKSDKTNYKINPETLLNSYKNIPSYLQNKINPETQNTIENLISQNNKYRKYSPFVKFPAAIGAGYEGIKHTLGHL